MKTIKLADWTRTPGGRFKADGPFSGEAFREDKLVPALEPEPGVGARVTVDLDGTLGNPASFMEEAFGGLVRVSGFSVERLMRQLTIVSKNPLDAAEAWQFATDAQRELARPEGMKTGDPINVDQAMAEIAQSQLVQINDMLFELGQKQPDFANWVRTSNCATVDGVRWVIDEYLRHYKLVTTLREKSWKSGMTVPEGYTEETENPPSD